MGLDGFSGGGGCGGGCCRRKEDDFCMWSCDASSISKRLIFKMLTTGSKVARNANTGKLITARLLAAPLQLWFKIPSLLGSQQWQQWQEAVPHCRHEVGCCWCWHFEDALLWNLGSSGPGPQRFCPTQGQMDGLLLIWGWWLIWGARAAQLPPKEFSGERTTVPQPVWWNGYGKPIAVSQGGRPTQC